MLTLRKMTKCDVPMLYDMALYAFQPDYERYGVYPPLLKVKEKRFLPPLMFGKVVLMNETIIGGAFVVGIGKKGEIGSIFIDPIHQKKGYGRQVMLTIEKLYPKVKKCLRHFNSPSPSFMRGIRGFPFITFFLIIVL